jgi:hypothetical protein
VTLRSDVLSACALTLAVVLLACMATLAVGCRCGPPPVELGWDVGLMKSACDRGSGTECSRLGEEYIHGVLVPADFRRGVALIDRGCQLRDERACSAARSVRFLLQDLELRCKYGDQKACENWPRLRIALLQDAGAGVE